MSNFEQSPPNTRRDRDRAGRPRTGRSRDRLGRPLALGEPGVPRQPEGITRSPALTLEVAQGLFDAGLPFHAHEVFEDAWKATRGEQGQLWRGLAQLAVGLTHAARGNVPGAVALLRRSSVTLADAHLTQSHGVAVAELIEWAHQVADQLLAGAVNGELLRPTLYSVEDSPGLPVELLTNVMDVANGSSPARAGRGAMGHDSPATAAAGSRWRLTAEPRQLDANVIHLPGMGRVDTHRGPDLDVIVLILAGDGTVVGRNDRIGLAAGVLVWLPRRSERAIVAGPEGLSYLTVHPKRGALQIGSREDR